MPEEALAEREHLRTGASANGAAPEGPPAGVPPVQRWACCLHGSACLAGVPSHAANPFCHPRRIHILRWGILGLAAAVTLRQGLPLLLHTLAECVHEGSLPISGRGRLLHQSCKLQIAR